MAATDGGARPGRASDRFAIDPGLASLVLVLAIPFVAHLPELAGWLSCNPILFDSHLARSSPGLLPGACYIDGNAGNTVMSRGHLAAEMWLHGRLPWWDHYAGAGLPLASEMQSTAMLLPYTLLLHFRGGMLAMKIALQATAGLATLAALRASGFSRAAAALGAVWFELGSLYAWFDDAPMQPVAFLPLLILGVALCGRARSTACFRGEAGIAVVAVAIAFSLYAGFPETAFVDGLFGLLWTVLVAREEGAPVLLRVGAGGGVGLLLAVPILVPFLQDLAISTTDTHALSAASVVPADQAAAFLFPTMFGAPLGDLRLAQWGAPFGYVGASASFLALASVVGRGRIGPRAACMLAWIAALAAVSFGLPGIVALARHTPLLDQLDFGRYVAATVTFAVIVLAADAFDAWQADARRRRPWPAVAVFLLVASTLLFLARHRIVAEVGPHPFRSGASPAQLLVPCSVAGGLAAAAVLARLLSSSPTRLRLLAVLAVGTAEALACFVVPVLAGRRDARLDLSPVRYLQANGGFSRLYAIDDILPNWGDYFRFGLLDETAVPLLRVFTGEVARLSPTDVGELFYGWHGSPAERAAGFSRRRALFLDAGVDLVDMPAGDDPWAGGAPADTRLVFANASTHFYRLLDATSYVEAVPAGACRLEARTRDDIVADCAAAASMIRREDFAPGWTARVAGHRAAIAEARGIWQRVALPAGRSEVRFRYAPPHLGAILAGFAVGLAALAWLVALAVRDLSRRACARRSAGSSA